MRIFLLSLLALVSIQTQAQTRSIAGATQIREEAYTRIPSFISLDKEHSIAKENYAFWLRQQFELKASTDFKLIGEQKDQLGFSHIRLQQTTNGLPVQGSMLILHSKGGEISSLNGDVFTAAEQAQNKLVLGEAMAFQKALEAFPATLYAWQAENKGHIARTFNRPSGELVLIPAKGDFKGKDWRIAYKFDIYAFEPMARNWVYVDAESGEILWNETRIHSADTPGTTLTKYSGNQNFITDSYNGGYRLQEKGRGGGIATYNVQRTTNYGAAVDFMDADNHWDTFNSFRDEAAHDTHWGMEQTFDYYLQKHNHSGVDGNDHAFEAYIHYDQNYFNAFWNGQFATFGDGNSSNFGRPLTCIDIVAHEFTHGVTGFSAGLIYQGESGALNESFSDIFGNTVEAFAKPLNWEVGEDIGALRSMSNPNAHSNPDTYQGSFWASTTGSDNGGVHTNSGVQNYWFYLMVEGGSGTNDKGNAFSVNPISMDDAAAIAYRNLTVYLTPSSDYDDARFFSIQTAADLYGFCTPQMEAVVGAWYAVGVGGAYVAGVNAIFDAPNHIFCQWPVTVNFQNISSNANNFIWNFGDGTTSTAYQPSKTYNTPGNYTISLIADGANCGKDTTVLVDFVSISTNNDCSVFLSSGNNPIQRACTSSIYDDGGINGNYSHNQNSIMTIQPDSAYAVQLDFSAFNMSFDDSLYIYDGNTVNSPLIGGFSGTSLPNGGTIISSGNALTLRMVSNGFVNRPGFEAQWSCIKASAAPTVDFLADEINVCDGIVRFSDQSTQGPTSWYWDFGDNNFSYLENPTHQYAQNGTYTVKLRASNAIGTDSTTKTAYINVNRPIPNATDAYICSSNLPQSASLQASGTGTISWLDASGNILGTGNTFSTPPLSAPQDFIARNTVLGTQYSGGLSYNMNGSNYQFDNRAVYFDVTHDAVLNSVKVYAQSAGNKTFMVKTPWGQMLASKTVPLVAGIQTVNLDFDLIPGAYQLSVAGNANLFYNSSGATYPYAVGNLLNITGSNSPLAQEYFFFYDWKVSEPSCVGEKLVSVYIENANIAASFYYFQSQSTIAFQNASSGATTYLWDFGDGNTSTLAEPTHTYTNNGIYTVTLYAQNGNCSVPYTQTVNIGNVSQEEATLETLSLYPNPGKGTFSLMSNVFVPDLEIRIYTSNGQSILSQKLAIGEEINLEQQAAGIYFVHIQSKAGQKVMKYVKE